MAYFLLGTALLILLLLVGQWFAHAEPGEIAAVLRKAGLAAVLLLIAFLVLSGRVAWAFAAVPVLLPWVLRLRFFARLARNYSRMAGAASGVASGQASDVTTRFLRVRLDHDSGTLSGEVREGTHAGRALDRLSLDELLDLLVLYRTEDGESARVLEAYLDRMHVGWSEEKRNGRTVTRPGGAMTRDEALRVLGLDEGAAAEDIKRAHHRLMAALHPDHGGSDYLAAKINQARQVLLDE